MDDKTPISSDAFHEILCRDFNLLRAPACDSCQVPRPVLAADGGSWTFDFRKCDFGCHHLLEWMVTQYSKQYRPRHVVDATT